MRQDSTHRLGVRALSLIFLAGSLASGADAGGSLALNPANYEPLAGRLVALDPNPSGSLMFDFSRANPVMIADGTAYAGIHDPATDWNVWCFGEVFIQEGVSVRILKSSDREKRAGDPIAILSRGDLWSSGTWNLKGRGWKGRLGSGYGPGGGRSSTSAGHAFYGMPAFQESPSGAIYNRGAPDGSLTNLFRVSSPLGSAGGKWHDLPGSNGGGALQLSALGNLSIAGLIDVSADEAPQDPSRPSASRWGCGGSGGTVLFVAGKGYSDLHSTVVADGGGGTLAGSAGRIAIYANQGEAKGTYQATSGGTPAYGWPGKFLGTLYFGGPGEFPFPCESGTRSVTLQGVVSDGAGQCPTGSYASRLRFYDASADGSLLDESELSIALTQGFFSVEVPFAVPVFRDHNLVYIEVWIDTNGNGLDPGDRFSERFKVTSVPFAENANRLDGTR